jgi:hypothetical protein
MKTAIIVLGALFLSLLLAATGAVFCCQQYEIVVLHSQIQTLQLRENRDESRIKSLSSGVRKSLKQGNWSVDTISKIIGYLTQQQAAPSEAPNSYTRSEAQ